MRLLSLRGAVRMLDRDRPGRCLAPSQRSCGPGPELEPGLPGRARRPAARAAAGADRAGRAAGRHQHPAPGGRVRGDGHRKPDLPGAGRGRRQGVPRGPLGAHGVHVYRRRADRQPGPHRGRALRNVMVVKIWLAGTVSVIAITSGSPFVGGARYAMLGLMATSMGAQLAAIRYCKVPDLATVVVTMTITAVLTEHGSGWRDPKLLRRWLAGGAFAIGALSGGVIILNLGPTGALG